MDQVKTTFALGYLPMFGPSRSFVNADSIASGLSPIDPEKAQIDAETLAGVRAQSAMSQRVFARMLNVSPKTLQSWEQGVRQPSDASRRLLQVFCEEPEVLCRIAGLPVVHLSGIRTKTLPSGVRKIVISR